MHDMCGTQGISQAGYHIEEHATSDMHAKTSVMVHL